MKHAPLLPHLIAAVTSFTVLAGPVSAAEPDRVLALAVETGRWLEEQAQPQNAGLAWPADAFKPADRAFDLGTGTAGIVIYFLSLYEATGDEKYRDLAEQGGLYLASLLETPDVIGGEARRASLYRGVAGIGVALALLSDRRPDFNAAVDQVVDLLGAWAVSEAPGVRWSDEFNDLLYGDAGTTLFLAWMAKKTRDLQAMELALSGARFLESRAEPGESGRYWKFRRSQPFNLPGFSHGTAGVAYVLASVSSLAEDPTFSNAAADGFSYLDSIAVVDGSQVRIPYGWPAENWEGLFEFGWAHGLVGADRFFTRLQQRGIRTTAAARYNGLVVNTLATIGLPGIPDAPFAEPSTPLDWRFGRASVLALLSDYGEGIETRDAIWRELSERAIRENNSAHWVVDAPEFMGGGRAAYTGILHGSAGIGLALLRLHAALVGNPPYVTMPDDPYAWDE